MDEYILMNDDTGFIAESDIENLCKLVDLHALMIQESYDEDLETVESYIESVISNYFNDIKAVQESDSEEVFIDPRVIKAAKVYKHNKENPSSTVFIDPKAVNAMAYARNSKEHTKKQLKPIIEEIIKDPNIKHIKLSDVDPYAKLYDAEGQVNTVNREKKELKEIKDHKTKDDPKFAALNKFMYDKMSADRDARVEKLKSVKPGKFNPGKKYRMEGAEMDNEFIMFNDEDVDDNSYQESYEPDDDVTLEDVESYLESMRNDITDAMELRDDMIQEEYEYEDLSLEDVESYIESNIDVYNDGVDLYNTMIMESDDNLTDDFEEGWEDSPDYKKAADLYHERAARIKHFNDTHGKHEDDYTGGNPRAFKNYHRFKKAVTEPTLHKIKWDEDVRGLDEDVDKILHKRAVQNVKKRIPKSVDGSIRKKYKLPSSDDYDAEWDRKHGMTSPKTEYALTDYRDNEIDLELDEPLTAYEFFDESYEPDDTPIVPRSNESIEYTQEVTIAGLIGLSATAASLISVGITLINRFITNKKYGRFPKDMKRVYEIIKSDNFEASENKQALKKAFKALSKDLKYMLHGFGSRWKITVNEAEEIRKLKRHVDDLYTRGFMITNDKQRSDKRRVGERIEGFLKQGNKVLEILNKSIYKNTADDAVTEWMV